MANAVIDSDASLNCVVGSESYNHEADQATGIELEDNVASTILDVPAMPDFGECPIWSSMTLGVKTACTPAVIPVWLAGVMNVEWGGMVANGDEDMAICAIGGVIMIEDAGTEIEIE